MTLFSRINIGQVGNDGTGDTLRTGGDKINDNYTILEEILESPIASADSAAASAAAAEAAQAAAEAAETAAASSAAAAAASEGDVDAAVTALQDLIDLSDTAGTGLVRRTAGWDIGTTIATAEIADDAVTFAKFQNLTTDRLVGRDTASSGNAEEISLNATLEFTGSGGIQRAALTGDVTAPAGSNTTTIPNDTVTYAKMQNISATARFLGRITASAGDTEELTGAQAGSLIALGDLSNVGTATPTKGYLLIGNGTTWEHIGVGTNDHVLTADSAQTLGAKWAAAPGAAGGISNGYDEMTDGSVTAAASGGDVFKFRGATGVTTAVQSNDGTHGDNLLITVDPAAIINAASTKATPIDADSIGLVDSAASNVLKKLTWANLKATLKAYTDTLYIGGEATLNIGYLNIPQNSKSAAYTTVLTDAGKHIFHPSADANARTFTIDSNANVPYPVGAAISFVNETSQVVTIAITSDTLTLAGSTTTGSRSLAQNGLATALKVTTTKWIISGTGLS